jgi:hypothetical protein
MSTPGRNDRKRLKVVAVSAGTLLSAAMIGGAVQHIASASAAAKDPGTHATPYHHHHHDSGDEDTHVRKSSKTEDSYNRKSSSRNNNSHDNSGSNDSSLIELNNVLNNSLNDLSLHILGL